MMTPSTPRRQVARDAQPGGRAAPARTSRCPAPRRRRRPSTAAIANGTRNQVGRIVVSAPIGSAPMAAERSFDDPASSRPKTSRITGPTRAAERRPAEDAALERCARQVAGVVGRRVDPAEPEAGHARRRSAPITAGPSPPVRAETVSQWMCAGRQDHVDDGEHAGDHRDDRLQAHHGAKPATPASDRDRRDHDQRHDLGRGPAAPAEPREHGRGRQRRQHHQHRLPADREQPRQRGGSRLPRTPNAARDEHHGRRRAAACRPARSARTARTRPRCPTTPAIDGLPEREPEAEHERRRS